MALRFNVMIGTAGADSLWGQPYSVTLGVAGDDRLQGLYGADNMILSGGAGNDIYIAADNGAITIDDSSGYDVLVASGIGLSYTSSYAAIIDGRHLLAGDFSSGQFVYVLDFRLPGRAIEEIHLGDGVYTFAQINSGLEHFPNFLGYVSWQDLATNGFPPPGNVSEIDEAISYYRAVESVLAQSADHEIYLVQGERQAYSIDQSGAVISLSGAESYVIQGASRLQFTDGTLAFDSTGIAGAALRLYEAAFNRIPDDAGLGYWIRELDTGVSLEGVAHSFIASDEFAARYGEAPSDEAFITALYQNVLDRSPDQAGFAYWADEIESGMSRAGILASFSESLENQQNTAPLVTDGIWFV